MIKLFKSFIFSLLIFISTNIYANDLCDLLLNEDFTINEVSVKDGYVVTIVSNIQKWKIYNQATLSEVTLSNNIYFPHKELEVYIEQNHPNLVSDECWINDTDKIKKVLNKIKVIEPSIDVNREFENKYKSFSVYKVQDNDNNDFFWMVDFDKSMRFEIVNTNEFLKFPFDKTNAYIDFEYIDLIQEDIVDGYEITFNDEYGENKKTQKEWNEFNINEGSGMYEFKIVDHQIFADPKVFLNGDEYANYEYSFIFKRNSGYYLLKVVLPVMFLVFLSFSVFWIRNHEIEAKLNVSIVCLLALIAYNFAVNSDIPKINSLTVLDSFILISYLFSGLSTFVAIYSYYDYRRDNLSGDFNPVDKKLRKIAPITYISSVAIVGFYIFIQ